MPPMTVRIAKPSAQSKKQQRKKQPVPLEERLKRLFASLCAQIEGGHFTNAIKTCNKSEWSHFISTQEPLTLATWTKQYGTALSLIADSTRGDGPDYTFEEAYAMYRLHREEEAVTALGKIKGSEEDHRGVLHLEAQLNYRQGFYQSSLYLYNELLETAEPQSEEYSDVLTNLTASQKHLDFINTGFLHALDALPSSIASTIETSPPPSVQPTAHMASTGVALTQQSPDDSAIVNNAKKVRMKRVPKGVIPGVTPAPDPERWLKKSERSSFGQGGRKRRGAGGATQGVVLENTPAQSHSGKSTGGGGTSHTKGKKKNWDHALAPQDVRSRGLSNPAVLAPHHVADLAYVGLGLSDTALPQAWISSDAWSPSVTSDTSRAGRDPNAAFHTINRSRWDNTGIFASVELTLTPYQTEVLCRCPFQKPGFDPRIQPTSNARSLWKKRPRVFLASGPNVTHVLSSFWSGMQPHPDAARLCPPCAMHALSATQAYYKTSNLPCLLSPSPSVVSTSFLVASQTNRPDIDIMTDVLGSVVIVRNGDRYEYYQDPKTYEPAFTESTPLGAVQSHQLGSVLRSVYLTSSSPSYINGIKHELIDNHQIDVLAKAGGEGPVIFDSAIALLQGLYPPNPNNKVILANETAVVAPLGGYQYIPIETVEPGNDRSLEPWTDCPAFEEHTADVYASSGFKATEKAAHPFFNAVRDYVFGRPTTLENAWNIYDYVNVQLIHNQTYAHRLPPTLIEQARGFANYHENAIFSSKDIGHIGNLAGRTILHPIISSLERIAFNGDPLQLLLIETSYHPFISLFHMLELVKQNPELAGIPNYASALAFELRRGPPPEDRDFLRIKFKNGTNDNFQTYHAFGHKTDIPLTEFIYRVENYAITSQKQWAATCSNGYHDPYLHIGSEKGASSTVFAACAAILFVGVFALAKYIKRSRAKKQYIRLGDDEVSPRFDHEDYSYGSTTANITPFPNWSRREFDLYD
ncbi:histidine phosphatase superfamily [Butyriboletus roseoflavus]|nr:histidine phosphatase superfamily [Butyriboletus roseoflavus]